MPYKMHKTDGSYSVTSPHGTKAKHTTKPKAQAQMRLLRGVEHGMVPRKDRARRIAAARVSRRHSGSVGERSMAAKRSAGGYARA